MYQNHILKKQDIMITMNCKIVICLNIKWLQFSIKKVGLYIHQDLPSSLQFNSCNKSLLFVKWNPQKTWTEYTQESREVPSHRSAVGDVRNILHVLHVKTLLFILDAVMSWSHAGDREHARPGTETTRPGFTYRQDWVPCCLECQVVAMTGKSRRCPKSSLMTQIRRMTPGSYK